MALMELGTEVEFLDIITVGTALEEKYFDLSVGDRGFGIQLRPTATISAAVLRLSNIKGEVSKPLTANPKPKFWTIPASTVFEGIMGIRLMEADVESRIDVAIPYEDIKDGTRTLQRWYVTSETANAEIEIMKIVGT